MTQTSGVRVAGSGTGRRYPGRAGVRGLVPLALALLFSDGCALLVLLALLLRRNARGRLGLGCRRARRCRRELEGADVVARALWSRASALIRRWHGGRCPRVDRRAAPDQRVEVGVVDAGDGREAGTRRV